MAGVLDGCALCSSDGGRVVFRCDDFRVIQADEKGFPAFYRVIWNHHVAEFSDLPEAARAICMRAVLQVEQTLRQALQPTKINLAALGNVVPHLHWHVIARFDWDSHFPAPVWAAAVRPLDDARLGELAKRCEIVNLQLAGMAASMVAVA